MGASHTLVVGSLEAIVVFDTQTEVMRRSTLQAAVNPSFSMTAQLLALLGFATAVISGSATPLGGAIKPYAMTCIGNTTDLKLNYFVKWGETEWTRASVSPQKWIWHVWTYNEKGESPELQIRFDSDVSPGQTWIVRSLEKYAAISRGNPGDCEKYGRRYQFVRQENQLIELTDID